MHKFLSVDLDFGRSVSVVVDIYIGVEVSGGVDDGVGSNDDG